ncbi:MAG: S9 family peptidase [Bacteroidetes bacterium]|nr:S9 family peptidase [Bacteroidota bacterium]
MRLLFLLAIILFSEQIYSQRLDYPKTHKENVLDTFFNKIVIDEYRWLENINDSICKEWVDQQNILTKNEIKKAAIKHNSNFLIDKYAYVDYDNPIKHKDYYFKLSFYDNFGVPALFVQNSFKDDPTILVDPNFISTKDNILIEDYEVSLNSKYLAYQFSRNGSDWCEIKVVNIKTGIHKDDHLKNVKFSTIAWKDDGFYYSKYPDNGIGKTQGQEVFYHQLGTEQEADKLVFKRANNPDAYFEICTTSDERFFILKEVDEKNSIINVYYIDFQSKTPVLQPLMIKLPIKDDLSILDNNGTDLIAFTRRDGNNGMIIKLNPTNPRIWKTVVPEYSSALLMEVKLLEDKIITVYLSNGKQQIVFFDYQGNELQVIPISFGFSVSGFNGEKTDKELLFSFEGYTKPKMVYILNTQNFELNPLRETVVNFDFKQFKVKELEYESFDGTKVPLSMVYKNEINLNGNNPTLLKAYGGFGVIEKPHFDEGIVHFLNSGGIFAFANIRGGGDKGKVWEIQGRGKNKPNSFKDFIAAAEYLIKEGYTSPDKLAITGGSNGGLVVGVAMTQRPELFKVAVPVVGVFDMIRFENFTVGNVHTDEFGSVKDSVGFTNLYSYSPLHNIKDNVNYPATLIMTSEFDDRVPPLHSYKFAAKLQNRQAQENPILLRVEKGAGHSGAFNSFKSLLKEKSDMYDFILYHLKKN